jgi:hypothetical protein
MIRKLLRAGVALSFAAAQLVGLPTAQAQQTPAAILGGIYYSAQPSFTLADKQSAAFQLDANGNLITVSGARPSYSAGVLGMTLAASPTDIFCVQGSATKLIKIKRVALSGLTSTALATVAMQIVKRSTANTGGTATNPTAVPHDTNDPAATATVYAYTANPTTGTLVGMVDPFYITAATATTQSNEREKLYGLEDMQTMRLRGAGEMLCLNGNGAGYTGTINIGVDWIEQ